MQQKDRKQMYRQQTMGYFINAALEIIEEEGIDSLSIRKTTEKVYYILWLVYNLFIMFLLISNKAVRIMESDTGGEK